MEGRVDALDRLQSRADIEDVMRRYARGVDRLRWDDVRACFHPGASDEHGDVAGTYEDMIAFTIERHKRIPFSQHALANCLIEFADSDSAVVETYFCAWQRMTDDAAGSTDLEIFGRYLDHFARRSGEWRIARRKVIFDAIRSRPSQDVPIKANWILGRRDDGDPIYPFRHLAGIGS